MSTPVAQDRVAVLQQSINEVVRPQSTPTQPQPVVRTSVSNAAAPRPLQLLHTGKALKAAHAQDPRGVEAIRSRLAGRMTETMDRYHNAVDDIEREVVSLSNPQAFLAQLRQ